MPIDPRSPMAPSPDEPSFALTHCPGCARDVLTAGKLDDDGELIEVCVHCDAAVPTRLEEARWAPVEEMYSLGYTVEGSADTSGNERGCRGGSCGVRQPTP